MAESKSSNTLRVLVPVLVIAILVVAATTFLLRNERAKVVQGSDALDVRVGATLADFDLVKRDGTSVKLSSLRKKVTLLNFWATWCGPCVEELPALNQLYAKYKASGLEILGVNMDEDPETALPPFLKKTSVDFPIFVDSDGALADKLSIGGLPFTAVIDERGKVLFVELGEREWMSDPDQARFRKWLGIEGGGGGGSETAR